MKHLLLALLVLQGCAGPEMTRAKGGFPIESITISEGGWSEVDLYLAAGVEYEDVLDLRCFGMFWKTWSSEEAMKRFGEGKRSYDQGLSRIDYPTAAGVVRYEERPGSDASSYESMACLPANQSIDELIAGTVLKQLPARDDMSITFRRKGDPPPWVTIYVKDGRSESIQISGIQLALRAEGESAK